MSLNPLWILDFFYLLFHRDHSALKGMICWKHHIEWVFQGLPLFAQFLAMGLCIYSRLLQEKSSSKMAEQDTNLWVTSLAYLVSGSQSNYQRWRGVPSQGVGLIPVRCLLITPLSFVSLSHQCILQTDYHCRSNVLWLDCWFPFSFGSIQSSLQYYEHWHGGMRFEVGTSSTFPCSVSCAGVIFSKRTYFQFV